MDARSFYGKKLVPVPAGDISDDDRLSDEDDPEEFQAKTDQAVYDNDESSEDSSSSGESGEESEYTESTESIYLGNVSEGETEEHEDDLSDNESESEVLQHSRITRSGKRTAADTDQDEVMNENESDSSSNGEPEPPIKKRIARKSKNQANKCQRKDKNTRKAKHKSEPTETKKMGGWIFGL